MKTLPVPSTVSPVKQARPASRQTLSAEWPGVATARKGPTSSPSAGRLTGTPNSSALSEWSACEWVRTTPSMRPPDASRIASRWAGSDGPGSTIQPPTR